MFNTVEFQPSTYHLSRNLSSENILSNLFSLSQEEKACLLGDTGFDVAQEFISFLNHNLQDLNCGLSKRDSLERSRILLRRNTISFYQEYIRQLPFLVANIKIGDSLLPYINKNERDGAVYDATEKMEHAHKEETEGLTSIEISPKGFSGMRNSITGEEYEPYEFSQIIVWTQEQGIKKSDTLVTDLTQQECRQLLLRLGENINNLPSTERDLVAAILRKVVIKPKVEGKVFGTSGVLASIQDVRREPYINRKRKQTFDMVYCNLRKREEIFYLDKECEKVLDSYEKKLVDEQDNVILELEKLEIRSDKKLTVSDLPYIMNNSPLIRGLILDLGRSVGMMNWFVHGRFCNFDIVNELEELQKVGGCNGGGSKKNKFKDLSEYGIGVCILCGNVKLKVGLCGICIECEENPSARNNLLV